VLFTFNTLKLDKTYNDNSYKRLVPATQYGLGDDFYGGRVKFVGETDTDVLLLVEYKDGENHVIDTAAEHLEKIQPRFIKRLCDMRKIAYTDETTKEELISKLHEYAKH